MRRNGVKGDGIICDDVRVIGAYPLLSELPAGGRSRCTDEPGAVNRGHLRSVHPRDGIDRGCSVATCTFAHENHARPDTPHIHDPDIAPPCDCTQIVQRDGSPRITCRKKACELSLLLVDVCCRGWNSKWPRQAAACDRNQEDCDS